MHYINILCYGKSKNIPKKLGINRLDQGVLTTALGIEYGITRKNLQ